MDERDIKGLLTLLVEDNPSTRVSSQEILYELTGRQPLVAAGYIEAIELLQQYRPPANTEITDPKQVIALVLLDQNLSEANEDLSHLRMIEPETAGLSLINRAKRLAPVAVVGIFTAYKLTKNDHAFESGKAGADFYLGKTLSTAETKQALRKCFDIFESRVLDHNARIERDAP